MLARGHDNAAHVGVRHHPRPQVRVGLADLAGAHDLRLVAVLVTMQPTSEGASDTREDRVLIEHVPLRVVELAFSEAQAQEVAFHPKHSGTLTHVRRAKAVGLPMLSNPPGNRLAGCLPRPASAASGERSPCTAKVLGETLTDASGELTVRDSPPVSLVDQG